MNSWDDGVSWYVDLVTAGTGNVITLAYLRDQHLRALTDSEEDPKIERALEAATLQAEQFMQRSVRDQTWNLVLDRFPASRCIVLPYPPLVSVTSINYIDTDGVSQLLATTEYTVFKLSGPKARRSYIAEAYDKDWPDTRLVDNAVTVQFRAGYLDGSNDPDVPADIMEAIAMRAAELYKQRSDSVIGIGATVTPALLASRNIWSDYRVY